jgi:acetolactate synthase regulatory subunit
MKRKLTDKNLSSCKIDFNGNKTLARITRLVNHGIREFVICEMEKAYKEGYQQGLTEIQTTVALMGADGANGKNKTQ